VIICEDEQIAVRKKFRGGKMASETNHFVDLGALVIVEHNIRVCLAIRCCKEKKLYIKI